MNHAVADRTTFEDPKDTWGGVLVCQCGWTGEVGLYPTRESAVIGLQAAWILHAEWES